MVGVVVKWGKQTFEVELDTSDSVETFKAQLFALTSVPIERQKIMGVKGGTLKDDAKFDALGIKPGQKLMMMGSADVLAALPPTATIFAEDLPQEAIDAAASTNPAGLANLGNTCYLNSSLQCLRAIPEVSTSLQRFVGGSGAAVSPANAEGNAFVAGMRDLDAELDRSNSAKEVQPFKFVSLFRTAYPMFAAQSEQRGMVKVPPLTAWSPLAVPQRGSGTSSVRAWWLWTAQHSQGEARPLWDPSNGLTALEPAASKAAHFSACEHPGRAASSSRTPRSAGT